MHLRNGSLRDQRAFSLIELLLYVGILGIVGGLLTGILTTATKTQIQQTSQDKLSGELSFAMQTIQRLVQSSSLIDMGAGTASSGLKLRMQKLAQDPTLVYLNNGTIYIQQGSSTPQALTDNQVNVPSLQFQKFSQYPGKDVVQIDIAMTDAAQPGALARSLRSAVSRASAATFDSDLIPGADNTYSVGMSGNRWENALFSGKVGIDVGGQLGIGTLAPSYPLDIETANNGIFVSSTATSSNNFLLNLQAGSTTAFYVRNDGNIGIGTSTPSYGLDIYNSFHVAGTSTFDGNIVFGGSTSTPQYTITNLATPTSSSDAATKAYVDSAIGSMGSTGSYVFATPGTTAWTVPSNAHTIKIIAIGGGGGGAGGGAGTAGGCSATCNACGCCVYGGGDGGHGGAQGGNGSIVSAILSISSSSLSSLGITVGQGGNGGSANGGAGSAGVTSSISIGATYTLMAADGGNGGSVSAGGSGGGSNALLPNGDAGFLTSIDGASPGSVGGAGGNYGSGGSASLNINTCIQQISSVSHAGYAGTNNGGSGGTSAGNTSSGGGGGGGGGQGGGAGGTGTTTAGLPGANAAPHFYGYGIGGSGGGGGGGGAENITTPGSGGAGSAGGNGIVIIQVLN